MTFWRHQGFRIDVLQSDEDRGAAGPSRFFNEARNTVAQRVNLQQQANIEFVALAQFDQAVENWFPIAVSRKIIVGDEKSRDALRLVGAHDGFDIVGGAIARLAALDIDDGAEAALERTASAGIEARIVSDDAGDDLSRQHRIDRGRHLGEIVEIFVDRLGGSRGDVTEHLGHAAFGFAGKQMNAEIERFLEIGRHRRQHGDAATDVEAAHDDRYAERPELPAEIKRAWKLVGLDADQSDHAAAGCADALGHARNVDHGIALIAGLDLDIDIGPKHAILGALFDQSVDARQAVRGQRRAQPLDDVTILVIVRWLD
jgi:hypothetical protein